MSKLQHCTISIKHFYRLCPTNTRNLLLLPLDYFPVSKAAFKSVALCLTINFPIMDKRWQAITKISVFIYLKRPSYLWMSLFRNVYPDLDTPNKKKRF